MKGDSTTQAGVTVVVPTLNRGAYLIDTLHDLLDQEFRPLEILIVDQSQVVSAELQSLIDAHPGIITYQRVGFTGLPNARNFGWQRARYETIVYVDDDVRCEPDFVAGHARVLCEQGADLCGGGVDEPCQTAGSGPPRYNLWLAFPEGGFSGVELREAGHVKGCNFSARRASLCRVRGFDEQFNVGAALHEETDLSLRLSEAGMRVVFAGSVRLDHRAAVTGGTRQGDVKRYVFALAHNRAIMVRRHSKWYQWPIGLAWSGKLVGGYTLQSRSPTVMVAGIRGTLAGWRKGGAPPVCTTVGRGTI